MEVDTNFESFYGTQDLRNTTNLFINATKTNSSEKPSLETSTKDKITSKTELDNAQSSTNINLQMYRSYFLSRQRQITNQLNSTLAGIKNFKLLDYDISKKNNFNFKELNHFDLGPYVVRAVITECNDQVKYQKDKSKTPLFYSNNALEIVKMIGLDVQIFDPRTAEVIESFLVACNRRNRTVRVLTHFRVLEKELIHSATSYYY